ncbi:MAG: 4Fe-4S dicluster domain-containing protein [Dehalococcoidales bacterium]|nr:4Fe-4S dicluster domain-containing protein [Dehalococcoidales bacterium]
MKYKNFQGLSLSALGFGAMRLPVTGEGNNAKVNEGEADRIITRAYESGVNYFDTAYSYHNGESERVLGRVLSKFPRESFYLATKYPGHEIKPAYDVKATFEEQLEKCGVEYFDFYLFHNVYENSIRTYKNPEWGILNYLLEQKKNGRIRHLGFSTHGRLDTMADFLDYCGGNIEFCQIQLNYLDWKLQDGLAKYELLTNRNIPVWVMEPVRGGKLASLSPENEAKLKAIRPDESAAAWAFRWLQELPNVTMILSGMSMMEQVEDNIKTFSTEKPLTGGEIALLEEVADSMMDLLPCTACRYCTKSCPQNLDIPTLLAYYNDCRYSPTIIASMAIDAMEPEQRPSACIDCGNCREACPQGIDVPEAMKAFQKILDELPHWGADPEAARKAMQKKA